MLAVLIWVGCVNETDPIDVVPVTWDRTTAKNAVNWFMNCWNQEDLTRYTELLAEDFIFQDLTYGSNSDTTIWNKENELKSAKAIYDRFNSIVMGFQDPIFDFKEINEEDSQGNPILGQQARINMLTTFYGDTDPLTITAWETLTFITDPQDSALWVLKKWVSQATLRAKFNGSDANTWNSFRLKAD